MANVRSWWDLEKDRLQFAVGHTQTGHFPWLCYSRKQLKLKNGKSFSIAAIKSLILSICSEVLMYVEFMTCRCFLGLKPPARSGCTQQQHAICWAKKKQFLWCVCIVFAQKKSPILRQSFMGMRTGQRSRRLSIAITRGRVDLFLIN